MKKIVHTFGWLNVILFLVVCLIFGTYGVLKIAYPDRAEAAGTLNELLGVAIQDRAGMPMIGLNYPTYIDVRVLAANVAETHTIPTGATYVAFSSTASFYVAYSGTAAVPATDITDGTGVELNPVLRSISGLTTISLIAPATCIVTMSFYKGRQ